MFRRLGRFVVAYTSILLIVFLSCYVASPDNFLAVWYQGDDLLLIVALLAIAPAIWISGWQRDILLTDRATEHEDKGFRS